MKCFALITLLLLTLPAEGWQWTVTGEATTEAGDWFWIVSVPPPPPPPVTSYWTGILDSTRALDWTQAGVRMPNNADPSGIGGPALGIPHYTEICETVPPLGATQRLAEHAYQNGDMIIVGNNPPNIFTVINAGTSAPAGQGPTWPTTLNAEVDDGTDGLRWRLTTVNGGDSRRIQVAAWSTPCRSGTMENGKVLQLTAGTYLLRRGISMNNEDAWQRAQNIVLRGAGPDQTKLYVQGAVAGCGSAHVCAIGIRTGPEDYSGNSGGASGAAAEWLGTSAIGVYHKGDTQVILGPWFDGAVSPNTPNTRVATVGTTIGLDQRSDEIGLCPTSGGAPSGAVGSVCEGKFAATQSGNTVTLNTTIPHHYQVDDCIITRDIGGGAPGIARSTAYSVGDIRTVMSGSSGAGGPQFRQVTTAGTTAATAPIFPFNQPNNVVTDGTVQWQLIPGYNSVGQRVQIAAQCPQFMAGGFLFKITSVPTPTSLTYDIPTTGLTNGNNGFVSRDPQGLIQVKAPPWLTENGPGYRLCPEVVGNGTSCAVGATCNRNPTCLPGERSQRPQTEIHVLKSFKEAGQDGCPPSPPLPTGSRCWELNSPISFNNWNQDRKPGAYFHNAGRGGHSNYVGFEDFSVDATNDGITVPNAGHVGIVQLTGCVNCWVKNLRLIRSARASVWIRNFSSQITVADNYAYYTKSPTSTSYMYETNGGVNDSLFVNNICQSGSVCMIQQTANSNVFAYNYGIAANNGNPVAHCTPMAIINHESGFWSLFEGNVTTSGSLDNVHGPGGAITMFRSRMRGNDWPAKWTSCYGFRTQMTNRVNNIIGSLVGGFGEVTGAEQMVSYEGTQNTGALFEFGFWPGDWLGFRDGLARTSSMRWGNWDSVNRAARWEPSEVPTNSTAVGFNNNPVPANQDLPPSFYVPTRPAFFTTGWGTPGWPPIGPDVNAAAGSGGGDPALDATCTGRDGSNNRIVDGPGSPFACTGAAHMAYQIPAQICFIRSAIDPEYEQTYHVTGGHWVRNYASAGQSNIPIVQLDVVNDINSRIGFPTGDCSTGAGPTSACQNATVVTIKGVVPDAYNGVVQLLRTQSTVIAYQPANPVGGGNWSATNPGPVTNTTGVVTWPNIRLFNGRQCYPQDFPAPSAQTRRH